MRRWYKILSVGDVRLDKLFDGPVEITEKLDGSQINFGVGPEKGLWIWSKGAVIQPDQPPTLFAPAVKTILSIQKDLPVGYSFHGEAVCSKRHNTLVYDRVPTGYIALYGIFDDSGIPLVHYDISKYSNSLGLDTVPLMYRGNITSVNELKNYLETPSYLGNVNAEGIVIKNYNQPFFMNGITSPITQAKWVTEAFKEKHKSNPDFVDPLDRLISEFVGEPRWVKAVQRRKETSDTPLSVKDIGPLIGEIAKDLREEEEQYIKDKLYSIYKKRIVQGITKGFPEWFKEKLAGEQQFN
jgi:hypothetical protein